MNAAPEPRFSLLWKGLQAGPYPVSAILEKLASGEINRMHQVNFNGTWMVLDDFLEKHGAGDFEAQRRQEAQRREDRMRREFEEQLDDERMQRSLAEERLAQAESRSSLSHLLRPSPPPEPIEVWVPPPHFPPQTSPVEMPGRTSGLAIASLVLGICNFVPFVNFVAWIPALILGHMALSEIKRNGSLEGRGLAIAGLAITYFLLVVGLTFGALVVFTGQRVF